MNFNSGYKNAAGPDKFLQFQDRNNNTNNDKIINFYHKISDYIRTQKPVQRNNNEALKNVKHKFFYFYLTFFLIKDTLPCLWENVCWRTRG